MGSIGRLTPGSKHGRLAGIVTVAVTAVVAVLGTGCGTTGSAGAGHRSASPGPSRAVTGVGSAPSGGAESLLAVAALGESNAWVVGTHTPLPKGMYPLTEHWDGQRWTAVPCPSPGGTADPVRSSLEAVVIDAPDDAWAVGDWSPIEHVPPSYPLIEHWNGARWTFVPVPSSGGHVTDVELTAVAAISPNAAWAIGEGVAGGRSVPVFMGWNGTRWRYLPSPVGDAPGERRPPQHADRALGRRTMATAAKPERPPWRPGGTSRPCDRCPEPLQRPGRRKIRSTPADRALEWRPMDDCAEQAPAGCEICVPNFSRSRGSPLRLGNRRRHPRLLHREMERRQLAPATKPGIKPGTLRQSAPGAYAAFIPGKSGERDEQHRLPRAS